MGSLCIIPAFEEEATIGQVVAGALKHCGTILVIDDNSRDRTAIVSRQAGATVIRHVLRLGTGAALSTGFRAALKTDSEIFLTMDGDGQHDPDQIPNLTEPILRDEADVVVGSRLLSTSAGMPLGKRIGNSILSATTSLAAGTRITDSQSGYRAYRRKVLEYAIHQDQRGPSSRRVSAPTREGNKHQGRAQDPLLNHKALNRAKPKTATGRDLASGRTAWSPTR